MTDADRDVISAMICFGGSFVSALGAAARRADDDNLRRIKQAWPEYWAEYSRVVKIMKERD